MRLAAVLGVIVSLGLVSVARADIRVPPEKKEPVRISSKVTIKHGAIKGVDRNVVAKIVVPVSLVHPAEPVARPGAVPDAPRAEQQGSLPRNYGTWIAGIALSLAAVSLVFVVRGKNRTRTIAATILGGAILVGAYAAQANVAPSPPAPRPVGPQIVIELVDEGDSVTLLLAE